MSWQSPVSLRKFGVDLASKYCILADLQTYPSDAIISLNARPFPGPSSGYFAFMPAMVHSFPMFAQVCAQLSIASAIAHWPSDVVVASPATFL